jgi:tetratricopeptide (TPR) repeat protein
MDDLKKSAYILYDNALKAVSENNISEALSYLNQSVEICGEDKDTLNLLGLCHYSLCDFDLARQYWSMILAADKEDNRAERYLEYLNSQETVKLILEYRLGLKSLSDKPAGKGIQVFLTIIKQYPDLVEPYLIAGLYYYNARRYAKAAGYWTKVLKLDRGNPKAGKYLAALSTDTAVRFGEYNLAALCVAGVSFILLIAVIILLFTR